MHALTERALKHIQQKEFLHPGDRVGVAVSGGIDSVALLRLLLELRHELGIVLSVIHFNHKLRGAESDADQEFVAQLAREYKLEFHCDSDDVAEHAAAERIGLEQAARDLRYGFFSSLLGSDVAEDQIQKGEISRSAQSTAPPQSNSPHLSQSRLNKIATGHTLDDQAETVLMRMIRGAGLRGLGGIHPQILVEGDDGEACGEIVRPLLTMRHRELQQYLSEIQQPWREDSSNLDERFTRNRLRKLVMPLLEKEFNPSVADNLAELSEIARGEEDYWENEIAGWLGTTVQWSEPEWASTSGVGEQGLVQINLSGRNSTPPSSDLELQSRIDDVAWKVVNASVSRVWFLGEPTAVQRRLVKAIGERAGIPLEFKHVEEILRFAAEDGPAGKELSLPLGWSLLREAGKLIFVTPDLREPAPVRDYEYELRIPGAVTVPEIGSTMEARRVSADADAGYNPEHLLDGESLPGLLRVRNWRPGDRFWPAHTKSTKKIKELLQELHVAQPTRLLWPVLATADEIVWLRGFPPPAKFQAKAGREGILISCGPAAK